MNRTSALTALLLMSSGAAASAQQQLRPDPVPDPAADVIAQAKDMPDTFDAEREAWEATGFGERVCPVRYTDPRDGTELQVVHSTSSTITSSDSTRTITRRTSWGDYWLDAPNRYGIELGQALRIDCVTGRPLGVVARFPAPRSGQQVRHE